MNAPTRRQALRCATLLLASAVPAARAAAPLCGSAPAPAYPAVDRPAIVQSWLLDGRQDGPPPDCHGLRTRDFELLVQVTASFTSPLDAAGMLVRLGAVSAFQGMKYWSFTERMWQPLVRESHAIDKPATMTTPRADFSASELRSGGELYFAQVDNRTGSLVPYSLQMLSTGADRLVMRIENVGELRYLGLKVVGAHEMQWVEALEPLGGDRWGYRSLTGIVSLGFGRVEQHRLSNLSRCVAMFDRLAGRRTEVEGYR